MKCQGQHQRSVFVVCRQVTSVVLWVAILGLAAVLIGTAQAQTFTVIHTFEVDTTGGVGPFGSMFFDANHNLYGTTESGGGYYQGTVWKIDKTGLFSIVVGNFIKASQLPRGGLVMDQAGNFYGNASARTGSVFKADASGNVTTFAPLLSDPWNTSLTQPDANGDIYGIMVGSFGGPCTPPGCGELYKVNVNTGKLTVLYTFRNGRNLWSPGQGVTKDANQNLYGSTLCGGTHGEGGIYEFTRGGKYKVLYNFKQTGVCGFGGPIFGPWGSGPLTFDAQGNLYGSTWMTGKSGHGQVFKFNPSSRKFTVLHNFTKGTGGWTGVVVDAKGNVYGTTPTKPLTNLGDLFEIDRAGKYKILHHFTDGADGGFPTSLIIDESGTLYGASAFGGDLKNNGCAPDGCGTIWTLKP
jgi:uncharacterized repeat protein (TIGR03803 family)